MPEALAPLAHHPLLEALPFVAPVLVIGAVLVVLAVRNRGRDEDTA